MKIKGSIDIGSNSILLLIGEFNNDNFKELANESTVTALGKDLDKTGMFHDESMEVSMETLIKYAEISKLVGLDPKEIIATATEAARVAGNSTEFFNEVKKNTEIDVKIISPEAEAHFSTTGICFDTSFKENPIHIMDIGGASTEIIKFDHEKNEILHDFSIPFGAVRITNWDEDEVLEDKLAHVLTDYAENLAKVHCTKLFCVAGTMTSVANMYLGHREFQEKEIHGLEISTKDIFSLVEKHKDYSIEQYLEEFPFLGKRSNSIKGGLRVATEIFKILGVETVEISTYGLRYGTIQIEEIDNGHLVR